jgi:hypothetical protein
VKREVGKREKNEILREKVYMVSEKLRAGGRGGA